MIEIEGKTSKLSIHDNSQSYWLDASKINIWQKHRFARFAMWEHGKALQPSKQLQMEMPTPDRKFSYCIDLRSLLTLLSGLCYC